MDPPTTLLSDGLGSHPTSSILDSGDVFGYVALILEVSTMVSDYELDQSFVHRTATHECCIRWTCIGNPTSPALIFVHGTPWSSVVWHDLATTLSTRYNIYLYDHPGFGVSPPYRRLEGLPDDYHDDLDASLVRRAEVSAALFKHWDMASPPHVVCHDNGGLVSLRLLLQHDVRFASLCLIDVVVFGRSGLPFFKLVAENESVFTAIPPRLIEGFVRAYVKSASCKSLSKDVEDMLSAPWLADGTQGSEKFLKEMVQAHYRDASDLETKYDRVGERAPTKIIWGKEDAWIPVETAQRLKKVLRAQEVVVVDGAGHLIHHDQPSRLAIEVGLWLDKNGRNEM